MAESHSSADICLSTDINCQSKPTVGKWNITWTIKDFVLLDKKFGEFIKSPTFSAGFYPTLKFYITVYPEGRSYQGYLSVYLNAVSNCQVSVKYSFSIIDNKRNKCHTTATNSEPLVPTSSMSPQFINRTTLFDESQCLLQNGCLTIFCEITMTGPSADSLSVYSYGPKLTQLSEDFNNLYGSSKLSDAMIAVGEKKFKIHKAVLAARSPVFAAMFEHPMKENDTNVVFIEDADAEVMGEVLCYMYSGKCPRLKELAADILPIADKYDLNELKMMAENTLSVGLTVSNAATTLVLADTHNAKRLKKETIKFINTNGIAVVNSKGWDAIASRPHLVLETYSAIFEQCLVFEQDVILQNP